MKTILKPILCIIVFTLALNIAGPIINLMSAPNTLLCTLGLVLTLANGALMIFCIVQFIKSAIEHIKLVKSIEVNNDQKEKK
jgi:hypothetical protein